MANFDGFGGIGDGLAEYETSPIFAWEGFQRYFNPTANAFRRFSKPGGEQEQLYDQWKTDYLAGAGDAKENARLYQDYTRNLLSNQPNQFQNYTQVGDYLYNKLDSFSNSLKDSGLRDMNARLAGLGIRPGSTGYDRLLNANRITNNLVPAYQTTTQAVGNDYARISQNDAYQTAMRLGLIQNDAIGSAMDRAIARPLNVANARSAQFTQNSDFLGGLLNNYKNNIAGWKTENTSDWSKAFTALGGLLNSAVDVYSGSGMMGGGGGGMGGMMGGGSGGGGGAAAPSGGGNQYYSTSMVTPGAGGGTDAGQYANLMRYIQSLFGNNGGAPSSVTSSPLGDWNYNPQLSGMA